MPRLVLLALAGLLACSTAVSADPRSAQVAGTFYPGDPDELRTVVRELLAQHASVEPSSKPRALILPHAGYRYSGPVAARGIREAQGHQYDAVVVIGFTHQQQFAGSSADISEVYETPLGRIPVDRRAVQFLKSQPGIDYVEGAHGSGEHSLEVMLPLLQVALAPPQGAGLGEFRLVPVLMGNAGLETAARLAGALVKLAAQGDYLFVFSTDLSHYHSYEQAVEQDGATITALISETSTAVNRLFDEEALEACGRGPIMAGLLFAEQMGYLERRLLLYQNSGHTSGDKNRVVGYAAIAMRHQPEPEAGTGLISDAAGQALVRTARQAIHAHLRGLEPPALGLERYADLARAQGLFVTLRKQGRLRGCIGRIQNRDLPLAHLLPSVALDSALRDPRFPPLTAEELNDVTIEVAVLSPPRRIDSPNEIVAGRDGVVLMSGTRSGVFLPQVWHETGWTRQEFLRELASQKAGLHPDAWKDATLLTFQDQAFDEGH